MRRYYTRVCNFYYGKESEVLVNKNKTIPLNGNKKISFDHIEIITRNSKKLFHISKLNSLSKQFNGKFLKMWGSNYDIPFGGYNHDNSGLPSLVRQTTI